jgi:NAD+ synthase (glutamine-hydrolysing)
MKLACAQINPTVADIDGNLAKIQENLEKAKELGAELVLFPELTLTGYPPRDLLEREHFVERNLAALDELAPKVGGITAIVGFVDRNPLPEGKSLYNAAAVIAEGQIISIHYKSLLPTYDVFDEDRYFEPAKGNAPVKIGDKRVAITICEDIWTDEICGPRKLYHKDPLAEMAKKKLDLIVNISASPYFIGKEKLRIELLRAQAAAYGAPVVLCNQVGGNDELVFDGTSVCVGADGKLVSRARSFEEDLTFTDLEYGAGDMHGEEFEDARMAYKALVLGTRDYCRKCGFSKVVLGLSGGVDSAVVAAIAAEALGSDNVTGVIMPSKFSSAQSTADAEAVGKNLGINLMTIPIHAPHDAFLAQLRPHFQGRPENTAEENLQARIRGNYLMALSNKLGWLVLSTGNKSETAVGYCTIYGDMAGGLAVISDVPKTLIYRLAREVINHGHEVIPSTILTKEPTAELRPNQKDSDSLPPYDRLDPILQLYIEERKSPEEIVEAGHDAAVVADVVRRVELNEYKRRQAAPGLKITSKSFGIGRRYPIARKIEAPVPAAARAR